MTFLLCGIDRRLGKRFNGLMQMDAVDVVAAIFHRLRDGEPELLLFRRAQHVSGAGFWEFPGGKVEPGEDKAQALAREIDEELGVQIQIGPQIGENTHQFPQKKIRLFAFLVQSQQGSYQLKDHDGFRWIKEGDVSQFKVSAADVPLLPAIFQYLRQYQSNK